MTTFEEIKNRVFDEEWSLYNLQRTKVSDCEFSGPKEEESPFKESYIVEADKCHLNLRYAFSIPKLQKMPTLLFLQLLSPPPYFDIAFEKSCIINSYIKGEYIGWYSKNMVFIDCTIESHQPFWYSKNPKSLIARCLTVTYRLKIQPLKEQSLVKSNQLRTQLNAISKLAK